MLADAIRGANVKGVELRQVHYWKKKEPLPWWQMIVSHDMLRLSPLTRGVITDEKDHVDEDGTVLHAMPPCLECGRDGRYHTTKEPVQYVYSRADVDLAALPDVVRSWESFGVSRIDKEKPRSTRFGAHLIFIKQKVYDIFRRHNIKHTCFGPVEFVD